ncbi:MAG: TolB protein [Thermodesulfobacteriota bacterium]|nr:TolB protein [Thermodesulfobacteriota bacterium]
MTGRGIRWWASLLSLVAIIAWESPCSSKLVIDVENPNLDKMPIAIPDFVSDSSTPLHGRDLAAILKNDLAMTGLFQIVESQNFPIITGGDPDFDHWSRLGVQALAAASFHISGDELVLEARLYDVPLRRVELGKRFRGKAQDHRRMIHRFGDLVMERLTNVLGCFSSRIAFAGEAPSREIYFMDFDGHNLTQATSNRTINLSPDWSPDGRSLLFTTYLHNKPDLWLWDIFARQGRPVSTKPGLNASGRFSPNGQTLAASMSFQGIPQIYELTIEGHIIKRLTSGRGNDISPTWSPDGSAIAFVSDQAGSPQIYVVAVNGGQPRRLTFQSNYNTDPDWSPRGDCIAFTARIDGRFQICTMKLDGTDFRILTDTGSNQEPAWSPDGRMIAFSSNRKGQKLIYVMDAHGRIQVPVSRIPGKAPAWSRNYQ